MGIITNIKVANGDFSMTAPTGTIDAKKTVKVANITSVLSDTGAASMIGKIAMKLTGTMTVQEYDNTFGPPSTPRPNTMAEQKISMDVYIVKYKRGGACEFKKK